MAKGIKGSKTEALTDTIAVKLTKEQKAEFVKATMKFGGSDEIAANVGNQGFGLACLALGTKLMLAGNIDDLVEAYTNASADQAKAIKAIMAEKALAEAEAEAVATEDTDEDAGALTE